MPTVAELTIAADELRRLRTEGIRLDKRINVGKAGITQGIVNGIHERWRKSELVKIRCEDICRLNMKRTHETLERKTGGLVVWRSGTIIILYRGVSYKYPYFCMEDQRGENLENISLDSSMDDGDSSDEGGVESKTARDSHKSINTSVYSSLVVGVGSPKTVRLQLPGEVKLVEEADKLLDGLGPRFTDWWGYDPLPVDADLLPAIVQGIRKPFRLLPFGVNPKLTDREMTILRRLGRPLPCHFALGRNRSHQGLAVSMIKLWEKCEIAKIAVKRGVQNTNSDLMAEELKELTGGTLLSRDREFIVFYRGKDFLPPVVSTAIEERRNFEISKQKQNVIESYAIASKPASKARFVRPSSADEKEVTEQKVLLPREKSLTLANSAMKKMEARLSEIQERKQKAEKILADLEKSVEPLVMESDREAISKEERYMLRKVGLRMKPFLLLGRRGVFAGTVENMHLHWKYRELVKIISNYQDIESVREAAQTLEAESGGILVAVERVSKGYAIIMYRGKNYRRPLRLRPETLLSKRDALKRSLEAQRSESLKLHVLSLSRNMDRLKSQIAMKDSHIDSMQSSDLSDVTVENDENSRGAECNNIPADSVHLQENVEEVHEADAESFHSKEHEYLQSDTDETITMPTNDILKTSKYDVSAKSDVVQSLSELRGGTSMPKNETRLNFKESSIHPGPQQGQASSANTNYSSQVSDEGSSCLSFEATENISGSSFHNKFRGESSDEIPFKAAPLSNKERLILRKQALKMRKRPVLAVGRSNVLAGVAKTIKTHFIKNPLAIVNIKGRASGTSVQELIFELEQATGAVLVSREPNKVILYRGWGEGEEPGGAKKMGTQTMAGGTVSPHLIAAIQRECGLQSGQSCYSS